MSFTIHVGPNLRKSPYFDATVEDGVRSFSVYNHMLIPGSFGDPEAEYRRLTEGVAMWDVAAQRQVEIAGPDAAALVQYLTPRDISGLAPGRGLYVPVCNYAGHVINDPVLLKHAEDRFWLSIADSDLALWAEAIGRERGLHAAVSEPDVAPMAIQGPLAGEVARDLFGPAVTELRPFAFRRLELDGIPLIVARSGWSKQGGFELYLLDCARAGALWARVRAAGRPHGIGPGAPNDTERLEGGLASYGADFRHQTCPADPFELGLGRFVDLDGGHDFVGRAALDRVRAQGPARRRSGLVIDGPALRPNEAPLPLFHDGGPAGTLSELAHSPRLGRNIAIALLRADLPAEAVLEVEIGGETRRARQAALPFLS